MKGIETVSFVIKQEGYICTEIQYTIINESDDDIEFDYTLKNQYINHNFQPNEDSSNFCAVLFPILLHHIKNERMESKRSLEHIIYSIKENVENQFQDITITILKK